MKVLFNSGKTVTAFLFITLFFITRVSIAQTLTVNTPSVVCINQTFTAIAGGYPPIVFYQWTVPSGATVNLNINASRASITFTLCGITTITCTAFTANAPPVSITHTINVICQPAPPVTAIANSTAVCQGFSTTLNASQGANSYTWQPGGSSQPTVSATAGTYTVSASWPPYDCISSNTINIASAPPLLLFTNQSDVSTCVIKNTPLTRKPVTLFAGGATDYYWEPYIPAEMTFSAGMQTDVRPSVNTCYTVTGLSPVCSGTAAFCVSVTPQFSINVTPATTLVCQGSTVNLGVTLLNGNPAAPGYTCQWTDAGNPASLSSTTGVAVDAFPGSDATYTVEVLNTTACISAPRTVSVNVSICEGIHESATTEKRVCVFPNPANDYLFLTSADGLITKVELVNAFGEVVLIKEEFTTTNLPYKLRVSELVDGVYFVKVTYSSGNELLRFVKN